MYFYHGTRTMVPVPLYFGVCIFTMVKYHGTEFKTRNYRITEFFIVAYNCD